MTSPSALRRKAGILAETMPPLLAHAERLAATVMLGEHGRRQAGQGDEFWQYRPAHEGDEARHIDWRRSARSDSHFVRQKEWQAAQSVLIWVDHAQSMAFTSGRDIPEKGDRARVLALAMAALLLRGGERVGLLGHTAPPRAGETQLVPLAEALLGSLKPDAAPDYGAPAFTGLRSNAQAVMISDFLGDPAPVETAVLQAADKGISGVLMQILDPQEERFPFDGRTIFQSMGGSLRHETLKAGDLRSRYLERLARRKTTLASLARRVGWQFNCHHTSMSANTALMWLYHALERGH